MSHFSPEENEYYLKNRLERLEYSRKYDIEYWCERLSPKYTFESFYFPLSYEEGKAITIHYRVFTLHSTKLDFSEEHKKLIDGIQEKIKKILDKNRNEDGFFIRLSSRSPKDACLYEAKARCVKRTKDILYDELKNIEKTKPIDDIDTIQNREYTALMKAGCQGMCVKTAEDAMELILNSERSYIDLMLYLDFPEIYEKFPLKVVIRKWNKNLPYENEFRGFVYNSKLTALSQYDNYCYFPTLQKKKNEIINSVKKCFGEIEPILTKNGFAEYICDFGILLDGTCIVIELNPFDHDTNKNKQGTGSACFSWRKERELLKNGPFEFRLTEKPPFTDLNTQVSPDWMKLINNVKRRIKKEKEENESKCILS